MSLGGDQSIFDEALTRITLEALNGSVAHIACLMMAQVTLSFHALEVLLADLPTEEMLSEDDPERWRHLAGGLLRQALAKAALTGRGLV